MAIVINRILTVKSPSFAEYSFIPAKHTCLGANVNPEINVLNIPEGTQSLAVVMDDHDTANTFVHWVMWNIPPKEVIGENTSPGVQGRNDKDENNYYGPCPPRGAHHYHFHLYALDTKLDLPVTSGKKELREAMQGHILASGELVGLFEK